MSELMSVGERGTFHATVLVWLRGKGLIFQSEDLTRVDGRLLLIFGWRARATSEEMLNVEWKASSQPEKLRLLGN